MGPGGYPRAAGQSLDLAQSEWFHRRPDRQAAAPSGTRRCVVPCFRSALKSTLVALLHEPQYSIPPQTSFAKRPALGFTGCVLFGWLNKLSSPRLEKERTLLLGTRQVPLRLVRHPRARRYLLRLQSDGTARVTVPRGGTLAEARAFAGRNLGWLETQLQTLAARPKEITAWLPGTEILFRGERVRIECTSPGRINFGTERLSVSGNEADLRPQIERHLRALAVRELPPRVLELATRHGLDVQRVTVRNQKSRWGSCSRRRTISLNWRLVQTPASVSDYIILHELAHLRQMNHSSRFWREVAALCPDYNIAELWLKQHRTFLR